MSRSDYKPPFVLRNGHLQTIWPSLFRKVNDVQYHRERIGTPDDDFLDVDIVKGSNEKAVIISHGLEGNSHRAYVKGMARAFNRAGRTVFAWNFRGCSGEMNRLPRFYHSGDTSDLLTIIQYAHHQHGFDDIGLVGFSMGGNMSLKLAGELGSDLPSSVRSVFALSVPCVLGDSSITLDKTAAGLYTKRFMRMLKSKIRAKAALMPGEISTVGLDTMRSFQEFDNAYTAPLHGFKNAEDYWNKSSCIHVLPEIQRPALLVNAMNDPFLPPSCYPYDAAAANPFFTLETPDHGGHAGFPSFNPDGQYWSERRALDFVSAN